MNKEQKEKAIEAIRTTGIYKMGAKAANIAPTVLKAEMAKSALFNKRILEAWQEGNSWIADDCKQFLADCASGKVLKVDRSRVVAAIAFMNAYEPGFKGTSRVEGKIQHDVRVITAVPRPKYIDAPSVKLIERRIEDENGLIAVVHEPEVNDESNRNT